MSFFRHQITAANIIQQVIYFKLLCMQGGCLYPQARKLKQKGKKIPMAKYISELCDVIYIMLMKWKSKLVNFSIEDDYKVNFWSTLLP